MYYRKNKKINISKEIHNNDEYIFNDKEIDQVISDFISYYKNIKKLYFLTYHSFIKYLYRQYDIKKLSKKAITKLYSIDFKEYLLRRFYKEGINLTQIISKF
jgi:predicted membrane-bound spermidine synthase